VHKYINYAIILCKASLLYNFNDALQFTEKISVIGTVSDNSNQNAEIGNDFPEK
jgi:hypothetical protein